MAICKRITYSGRVQGVGFRYATHGLAGHHAVTGYVRNLPDGDVEVVAQGEPDEIERFLTALERRMGTYIAGKTVEDLEPATYRGFGIRL